MTPPPASGAGTIRRPLAPHAPRRVSGPARRRHEAPRRATTPSRIRRRRWLIALPRLVGRFAATLPDSRALDRLIRGRAWIAIVATALIGIVYLQVSLLGMNQGISRAVHTAQTLQTQNTVLQSQIAQAAAGGRVQDVAARAGMVMPPAAWPSYVSVQRGDAARAARSITPPDPAAEQRNAAANAALVPPGPVLSSQATSSATPAAIAPTAGTAAAAVAAAASTPATATATATGATAAPAAAAAAAPVPVPAPAAAATATAVSAPAAPTAQNPAPVAVVPASSVTGGVSASSASPAGP